VCTNESTGQHGRAHSRLSRPWAGRGRGRGSPRPSRARRPLIVSGRATWSEVQPAKGVQPRGPPTTPRPRPALRPRGARSPILDAVLSTDTVGTTIRAPSLDDRESSRARDSGYVVGGESRRAAAAGRHWPAARPTKLPRPETLRVRRVLEGRVDARPRPRRAPTSPERARPGGADGCSRRGCRRVRCPGRSSMRSGIKSLLARANAHLVPEAGTNSPLARASTEFVPDCGTNPPLARASADLVPHAAAVADLSVPAESAVSQVDEGAT